MGSAGDDDLPFGHGDVYVAVVMGVGATEDQVEAIFDELDRQLDEDHVESLEVRMAGPKLATLTTGGDLQDSHRLAEDLVTAYADDEILSYEHGGSYVSVRLSTEDFDDVVAAADRYGDAGDPDSIFVAANRFRLDRGDGDEDPGLTAARTRFVQRVDDEIPLTGAVVSSYEPLELWTARKHRDELRAVLAGDPDAQWLGTVVTRSRSAPWP